MPRGLCLAADNNNNNNNNEDEDEERETYLLHQVAARLTGTTY